MNTEVARAAARVFVDRGARGVHKDVSVYEAFVGKGQVPWQNLVPEFDFGAGADKEILMDIKTASQLCELLRPPGVVCSRVVQLMESVSTHFQTQDEVHLRFAMSLVNSLAAYPLQGFEVPSSMKVFDVAAGVVAREGISFEARYEALVLLTMTLSDGSELMSIGRGGDDLELGDLDLDILEAVKGAGKHPVYHATIQRMKDVFGLLTTNANGDAPNASDYNKLLGLLAIRAMMGLLPEPLAKDESEAFGQLLDTVTSSNPSVMGQIEHLSGRFSQSGAT